MKTSSLKFESTLSVQQIGQALNRAYSRLKANVEPVEASSNPLDTMGGSPDIAVVGTAKGIVGGRGVFMPTSMTPAPTATSNSWRLATPGSAERSTA